MSRNALLDRMSAHGSDDLATPLYAAKTISPYLRGVLWEPMPGEGVLVGHLRSLGHTVIPGVEDFFIATPPTGAECVVSNPPFSKKAKVLARCRELGLPWAMLLPVSALGSHACQKSLDGAEIVALKKRVNYTNGSGCWFSSAWFTWGLGLPTQLVFAG